MNITLIILVIEVAVVCLGIVAIFFYFRWKNKKNKIAEFETLLDNVSNQKDERKAYLIKHLVDGYAINSNEATEAGAYMIEAEKQFLQQFMKQQIEGGSVTDFYQNLCELLDQYLYFVPTNNAAENSSTTEAAVVEQSLIGEINSEEKSVEENEPEPEPDWGDAFAESGEEVDEATKAGFDAEDKEQGSDSEKSEEDPGWGDAFAESGDEVDEATKEGFDAENK